MIINSRILLLRLGIYANNSCKLLQITFMEHPIHVSYTSIIFDWIDPEKKRWQKRLIYHKKNKILGILIIKQSSAQKFAKSCTAFLRPF